MTEQTFTASEIIEAVEKARENWDTDVYPDDDARIAARIGAVNVLRYLND
jgi:hypothetical protein